MKKTLFLWFSIVVLSSNLVSADNKINFVDEKLLWTIVSELSSIRQATTNLQDKKEVVQAFCSKLKNKNFSSEQNFPSNQSLFLALLCNHNGVHADYFQETTFSYLKKNKPWDSELLSYKTAKFTQSCQSEYQEKCNLALLADEIMTQLFSELFTLKQAEIFGLTTLKLTSDADINKEINKYVLEKFAIPSEGKNGFCWENEDLNYPKTCALLKKQMKSFLPTIQKFKLLDPLPLYDTIKEKNQTSTFKSCQSSGKMSYDIVLCGTLWETDNGLRPFINMLYNELTRYFTFTTYYKQILNQRNIVDEATSDEISQLEASQEKLLFLTNETLEDLVTFSTSYPIHIGMLMYQEDLLRFRNRLSKVVTPFYTLYHKLRNVQEGQ